MKLGDGDHFFHSLPVVSPIGTAVRAREIPGSRRDKAPANSSGGK